MSFRSSITRAKRKPAEYLKQVGSRWIAGLLFFGLCLVLAGCGLTPPGYLDQRAGRPAQVMVENVPFYAQDALQCGPAALAMVLGWSGVDVTPADLSAEVFTPGLEGSLQNSLVGAARRHARVAYPIAGADALLDELAAGHPVIVLVNLGLSWYPQWHYAVVIGYDQQEQVMILHSGLTAAEEISFRTFNNIWQRADTWGLLVLPGDRMPADVEADKWLTAVGGLERAGRWRAAAEGYAAALKRWDRNFVAWMGLGNSQYNLGALEASAEAFSRATLLQPENGIAYNNLAHVLAEQGKLDQALLAAQRAVDLGGPLQDTFRVTLDEIIDKKAQ